MEKIRKYRIKVKIRLILVNFKLLEGFIMEFKMINKLLAVVFAASTIGSTVSSVGAFNE